MAQQERRRILFVGGVAPHISEQALFEHFSQFCDITKVRIMREKKTRESKGYAYITVADSRRTLYIMSVQHLIMGRKLDVQLATSKGDKREWKALQRCRRVYAVGLPPGTTNEQVAAAFQQFGEVRNAFVIREHESRIGREYAYIQFEDDHASDQALSSVIKINGKRIACQPFWTRRKANASYKQSPDTRRNTRHAISFEGLLEYKSDRILPNLKILNGNQNVVLDAEKNLHPANTYHYSARVCSNRLAYDSPSNYRFNLLVPRNHISRMN